MKFYQKLTEKKGVALFIVLASMATLAIFVSEITYTAQINQKLAYDRLDQVKAQSLAKSGLRIALLRIRAYTELKKQIGSIAGSAGGAAATAINSMVPKAIIEKIWSEPITIPFSGDISSLPGTMKDALMKFRKDSGMEGKLYISIQAQSNKFNLNCMLPHFAAYAANPSPSPGNSNSSAASASPSPTPVSYSIDFARQVLGDQLKTTFQKKFDADEKFRDRYRSFRIDDLVQEIISWSDIAYDSLREQQSSVPFKKAPFYHLSELHYLPSMDDEIYNLMSEEYSAGVASYLNVNQIKEPVLRALVPQMTNEEVEKFFKFRDSNGSNALETGVKGQAPGGAEDNTFKTPDDFFKYLKDKVQYFGGSATKIQDFQNNLTQRGVQISVEENNFLVHIEATVQQTKRTLEAMVSLVPDSQNTNPGTPASASPTPSPSPGNPGTNPGGENSTNSGEKSNFKITQLRFL